METISPSKPIKNIAFVGSTGSGKSTSCNTISGLKPGPFIVGHDELSCTSQLQEHVCVEKRIRVIDMVGFQDNRKMEKEVDQILRQIILKIADPTGESTNNIDAFVLVCKLNPRPQTLKKDLERMKALFGSASLKSLILLIIYEDGKSSDFLSKLKEMKEIVRILQEAKEEEPHEGWFCLWDNLNPIRDQEKDLMRKIAKLQPYTYRQYIEAEKEIKVLLDRKIEEEMRREIARISAEHENDQTLRTRYIQEIQEKYSKEKEEVLKATENAQREVGGFLLALTRMNEEHTRQLRELHERMRLENEENEARTREFLMKNEQASQEKLNELMEHNSKLLAEQNERFTELLRQAQENQQGDEDTGILGHILGTITKAGSTLLSNLTSKFFDKMETKLSGKCNMF